MQNLMVRSLLFFSLFVIAQSAVAEVKHIAQHGFVIENTIETDASTELAWQGLVKHVDAWWPKDHSWWMGEFSIDANAGGCFCETKGEQSAEHMRIVFVDPQKVLRMTGGLGPLQGMGMYGALDWTFTELESGKTQIKLSYAVQGIHSGGFEQLAPIVDKVQAIQLGELAEFLKNQ